MTSIVLPESVTTLGDWAFSGCTSLTSMVLPESVTTIDDFAFVGCTSLATLIVFRPPPPPPPAVADSGPAPARLTVHPCAFECPNLKRVSAPDEVVAALDEPYEACATLAALPAAVTCNAFKLQIETYFWSMKLHRNTNRLSARQRAWVKHLLTVGSRARLHWRPVGKGPRSEPCLPAPNHPPLPCIMNDVWLHVLLFVKLSEMCAVDDPLVGVDVSKWKVAELKAELKRRHLIVGGKKAALVERLAGDVASKACDQLDLDAGDERDLDGAVPGSGDGDEPATAETLAMLSELQGGARKKIKAENKWEQVVDNDVYEVTLKYLKVPEVKEQQI